MERTAMINFVRETLAKAGFFVSDPCNTQGISFDIMARRDDLLLIIKVLVNVDAYDKQHAHEIKVLAKILKGTPLLIGERSGQGALETGVLYLRQGISLLSAKTLEEYFIEGVPPYVYAAHGGFYVNLDVELLKQIRKERKLSLGQVAEAAGVSRKSVQMYEEGVNPTVEVGMRLAEFLENNILLPLRLDRHPKENDDELTE
ncbi:MAG: helix-turn-helix domain-containing protein, partial [Thermoplasmata archaeon]